MENTRFIRKQEGGLEEALLDLRRVTKVTKGGKNMRFRAAIVMGDKNGRIGFGMAKAAEVPKAVEKAKIKAQKNMITFPIIDGTIPFAIDIKFKSAKIFLKPASAGTGLIVGRLIRPLVELSGITNILSKVEGCRDKVVNAQAMMAAFSELTMLYNHFEQHKKKSNKTAVKPKQEKSKNKIKSNKITKKSQAKSAPKKK
jgi:small subunit ribosomal protein S5